VSLITAKNGWPQLSDSLPLSPWPGDGSNAIASGAAVASAGTRRS
jgi:hypothetical protein